MGVKLDGLLEVPESRRSTLLEIVRLATSARRVVLTTHVNADADGAGSESAVAAWLEGRGVVVNIINPSPFPPNLKFLLHREDLVVELSDPRAADVIADADLVLVLDTSERNRVAPLVGLLDRDRTWVVDHHPAGPEVVGRGGVQDTTASATGELVYDMISLSGDQWSAASAQAAYVALVSDTGSFRFSNTSPRAHAIAAHLLSLGVDPERIFDRLFAVVPRRRVELLREALARLEHDPAIGLSWIALPGSVSNGLGATSEDYEGLIEHARSIEGTRVALLFRELGPAETKVSLRSSGSVDVNRIARGFGGGGHVKASGASIPVPLEVAVRDVLAAVRLAMTPTQAV